MSLLAVERIKLISTRSIWWCSVLAVVVSAGFGALFTVIVRDEIRATVATTQMACSFGRAVVLVMDSDLTVLGLSPDHLPMGPAGYGAYFAAISVLIFLFGVERNRKRGLSD